MDYERERQSENLRSFSCLIQLGDWGRERRDSPVLLWRWRLPSVARSLIFFLQQARLRQQAACITRELWNCMMPRPSRALVQWVWTDAWPWVLFSSFHGCYKRDFHEVLSLCCVSCYINAVCLHVFHFPWAICWKICFEIFSVARGRGGLSPQSASREDQE